MASKLGARGEMRRLLREHALKPEHQGEAHFPSWRRRPLSGLDLRERLVQRASAAGSGRENSSRVFAFAEEGLAGPGFRSEGGGRKAVRGLRGDRRNLGRFLHARSAGSAATFGKGLARESPSGPLGAL